MKAPVEGAGALGFAAMAIPISRGEIDYAEGLSKTLGMTPVEKQITPPPTPDYTPFATKLKDANPNWVYSWAPWVSQVRTFEALRRLGWNGRYITWAHLNAEDELARLKDGDLYVFGTNAFFQDDLPVHAEIRAMTHRANLKYPITYLTEGFIAGLVLESALQEHVLAADAAEGARRDEQPQGRPEGPARRPARVDEGQPLPHPAVLPRLALGPGEATRSCGCRTGPRST